MNKISKIPTLFITLLILLMMAVFSFASGQTRTFDLSPGQKIKFITRTGGDIHIEGWNKSEVESTVGGNQKLSFEKTDFGLEIIPPLTRTNYRFKVPHNTDIEFFTAAGSVTLINVQGDLKGSTAAGRLRLEGLKGKMKIETFAGNVRLDDVKGDVEITTFAGEIKVTNSEVDGKVHTNGGALRVQDVVGKLSASTNGGGVTYRNVSTGNGKGKDRGHRKNIKEKAVHVTTMGGAIDFDDAPDGAVVFTGGGSININNADKYVEAKTGGGSIKINNADRYVEANTGGGSINISIKSGTVKATTGAGEVDVTIDKDTKNDGDVTIFTGTGDVTVTVPSGFSMELDIDLAYTRNSFKDYKIISDFDFKIEETDKWDYSQGSPRKHIYGTGKIAGGRHKIKIRSVNGNVEIKKK